MRMIFSDKILDEQFKQNGYVVINNFLESSDIESLKSIFEKWNSTLQKTMVLTNLLNKVDAKKDIHFQIIEHLYPQIKHYVLNYKPVHGIFAFKPVSPTSEMCLHRDWTLVDEAEYTSLSFWVLLSGEGSQHGSLRVLPGSHKKNVPLRGRNFPFQIEINKEINESIVELNLKVGDVVVFNHALIHGSGVNSGELGRLAAVLALVPEESPFLHFFRDITHSSKVEVLEMDENRFYALDFTENSQKPECIRILKSFNV